MQRRLRNCGKIFQQIREQLARASQPEDYEAVQSNLRGELRLYRDQALEWLEKIGNDLKASALAMRGLAENLSTNGNEHEAKLEAGLRSLASVADSGDLTFIKKVTLDAAASISESWRQLRCANQLVIAQLNDEILSLHRQFDTERRAMFTDSASGAWNRQKFDQRIEDNLREDAAFSVLIASITNLRRLSTVYSRRVTDGALRALVKRIFAAVGKDAIVGRWTDDQFAILLEMSPEHATTVASEITQKLLAAYSIQDEGIARNFNLRVTTSLIGRSRTGDASRFREKLAMMDGPR